ncbi:MAG: FHA domain-containing protein, partial [Fuerstiella sp.]|nr:FHA domain-containing protein [Fuerstiella sp.]
MTALVIQSGKHKGTRLTLPDKDIIIGRDQGCGIRLASNDVSRQHCRLRWKSGQLHVCDLGSQNGTLVNDQTLTTEVPLQIGDRLQIAKLIFVVSASSDSKTQAARGKTGAAKKTSSEKGPLTDDDIADWLGQDEMENVDAASTTMIMPRFVPLDPDTTDTPQTLTSVASERKPFDSVSEEARDI